MGNESITSEATIPVSSDEANGRWQQAASASGDIQLTGALLPICISAWESDQFPATQAVVSSIAEVKFTLCCGSSSRPPTGALHAPSAGSNETIGDSGQRSQ